MPSHAADCQCAVLWHTVPIKLDAGRSSSGTWAGMPVCLRTGRASDAGPVSAYRHMTHTSFRALIWCLLTFAVSTWDAWSTTDYLAASMSIVG